MTPAVNSLLPERYDAPSKPCDTKHGILEFPKQNALSNRERNFLSLAMKVAEDSDLDSRHGAVVVKGGRVLSLATNKKRNDLNVAFSHEGYQPVLTTHAEVAAMNRISADQLRGAIIYVARVDANGKPLISRPCFRCMDALVEAGVKKVVYTTS